MNWALFAIKVIDYLDARANAAGEDSIPQDLMDARTEARREVARQADERATDPQNNDN